MSETLEQTLVFLDVETTGLSPRMGDRVVEIAMVRARGSRLEETYHSMVNPGRTISPGASAVNGIYDEDVRGAPTFEEIADDVIRFMHGGIIVCHNAPFDLGFLSSELQRARKTIPALSVLDTLEIARAHYDFSSNGLQNIARVLGFTSSHAHRALDDAMITFAVFNFFAGDVSVRGRRSLDYLLRRWVRQFSFDAPRAILPPELEEAFTRRQRVWLEYVDTSGARSTRWVTPRGVVELGDAIYLIAYCHLREAERNFRWDRIVRMEFDTT